MLEWRRHANRVPKLPGWAAKDSTSVLVLRLSLHGHLSRSRMESATAITRQIEDLATPGRRVVIAGSDDLKGAVVCPARTSATPRAVAQ
eukprot:12234665-Alexandrium_andersonii.AAC.1